MMRPFTNSCLRTVVFMILNYHYGHQSDRKSADFINWMKCFQHELKYKREQRLELLIFRSSQGWIWKYQKYSWRQAISNISYIIGLSKSFISVVLKGQFIKTLLSKCIRFFLSVDNGRTNAFPGSWHFSCRYIILVGALKCWLFVNDHHVNQKVHGTSSSFQLIRSVPQKNVPCGNFVNWIRLSAFYYPGLPAWLNSFYAA